MKAVVSFGSNMGQRREYIREALERMEAKAGRILAVSPVIETKPYGYTAQAGFLNGAVLLDTELEPRQLLEVLLGIEAELDRVRKIHWGPRTIDLDIVFYGDRIIDEEDLHIPHPDFMNRAFVLGPVCQIAPDMEDPRSEKTVRQLYAELQKGKKGIGITGFSPLITIRDAEETVGLFEALGFEVKHTHAANVAGTDVYTYVMRNADGCEVNISEAPEGAEEGTGVCVHVEDFTRAYDYLL